jgi:hypothetical protein
VLSDALGYYPKIVKRKTFGVFHISERRAIKTFKTEREAVNYAMAMNCLGVKNLMEEVLEVSISEALVEYDKSDNYGTYYRKKFENLLLDVQINTLSQLEDDEASEIIVPLISN